MTFCRSIRFGRLERLQPPAPTELRVVSCYGRNTNRKWAVGFASRSCRNARWSKLANQEIPQGMKLSAARTSFHGLLKSIEFRGLDVIELLMVIEVLPVPVPWAPISAASRRANPLLEQIRESRLQHRLGGGRVGLTSSVWNSRQPPASPSLAVPTEPPLTDPG